MCGLEGMLSSTDREVNISVVRMVRIGVTDLRRRRSNAKNVMLHETIFSLYDVSKRRLVDVADGTKDMDAVILRQVSGAKRYVRK